MLEAQQPPEVGSEALRFDNLSFYIEDKTFKEKVMRRPGRKKCILENISGAFNTGEMIALMGASGCGKTTLMDILACRKSYGIIEGEITYSGQLRKKLTNSEAGYVPQADIAMANLTVRETINYAIRLRIPNLSREEMNAISTKLMEDLMIAHCADTRVGSEMVRGISGGELRRLSIAQDLVNNPSLLFLDEPTSGLDSYASYEVVSILKRLAKSRNQLIIMTIHQPSPQIFYQFDKLLLLTKSYSARMEDTVGRVGYYGPISDVAPYFANHLRIPCPPEVNIADHIINETSAHKKNQVLVDEESKTRKEQTNFADKFAEYQRNERRLAGDDLDNDGLISMHGHDDVRSKDDSSRGSTQEDKDKARAKELKAKRKEQKRREKERWESMDAEEKKEAKKARKGQKYPTSMFNQYITLVERSYIDAFRSPDFIFNRLIKPHVIGFIIWTIYFQLSYSPPAIQNRISCVFFTLLSSFMLSQALIPIFIVLRPMANREKGAKLYGAFVQMFVQLTVVYPIEMINGFIYITYINWATHLFPFVDRYFQFALMYLSFLSLMMLYAMMIGSISTTGEKAAIIAPIFFLFALVVCGFFILISVMPPWWSWARWISPLYYALNAAMWLQFHDITWNCTPPEYNCTFADGNAVLAFYSAELSPQLYWAYQSAVWGFILLCGTILYLSLRFIRWDRR